MTDFHLLIICLTLIFVGVLFAIINGIIATIFNNPTLRVEVMRELTNIGIDILNNMHIDSNVKNLIRMICPEPKIARIENGHMYITFIWKSSTYDLIVPYNVGEYKKNNKYLSMVNGERVVLRHCPGLPVLCGNCEVVSREKRTLIRNEFDI